jgi:hypothetical protein
VRCVCGYRIDERHCLGHVLREPNPAHAMTREVYLSEYVPPPYVRELRGGRRLGKTNLTTGALFGMSPDVVKVSVS